MGVVKGPADHAKECGLDPVGKGEPIEALAHECIMTPTRGWFQRDFLVPVWTVDESETGWKQGGQFAGPELRPLRHKGQPHSTFSTKDGVEISCL